MLQNIASECGPYAGVAHLRVLRLIRRKNYFTCRIASAVTAWRTQKRGLATGRLSIDESPAPSPGSSSSGQDLDEYEQWQRDINDSDALVTDPYEYWHTRRLKYPRLSRMALDLLTVPPMSAECERLFSTTGRMVTKSRNRLDASTIGLCQTLRSWLHAGLISSLDRILMEQ